MININTFPCYFNSDRYAWNPHSEQSFWTSRKAELQCLSCLFLLNIYMKLKPCISNNSYLDVMWMCCLTSQSMIFQSYMWRHIDVQADWRKIWPTVRLPMPLTFRRVLYRARPSTNTGPPFLYGYSEKPPHLVPFYDMLGIRRTNSRLKPPGPHGATHTLKDNKRPTILEAITLHVTSQIVFFCLKNN